MLLHEKMPWRQPADRTVEIDQRGMLKCADEGDSLVSPFQVRLEECAFPRAIHIVQVQYFKAGLEISFKLPHFLQAQLRLCILD